MRLISATVRNYRVHRELSVEFDPSRHLIGGPNESGKSTLIEAVHRALFLKATITGEVKAGMQSTSFPGNPEVEVVFETGGAQYQLAKRFSGQTGTTRLTRVGGETWQGDEAQARLAALLGVNEPASGRATSGWLTQQWSHLWVWQGQSGKDPSGSFAPHQADLLQQLQRVGGAVAMQSELDGRVASRFSVLRAQIFTQAGAPKSDRGKAAERVEGLRQATKAYEDAAATIARTASDLEDLGGQRRTVGEKLTQLETLRNQEKTQVSSVDVAAQKLTSLESIEEGIAGLRAAIATAQEALGPMEREQQTLEARVTECREKDAQAEKAYEQALQRTRDVRLRRELAAAHVDLFQKADRCQDLGTR
jgi:DNA repair exonuclease SbcCD ATPase subunit